MILFFGVIFFVNVFIVVGVFVGFVFDGLFVFEFEMGWVI